MAAVLSTESPSCATGSPGIPRGWLNHVPIDFGVQLYSLPFNCCSCLPCLPFSFAFSFAYIEFSDRDSVTSAIGLHETLFRGRVLKVSLTLAAFPLRFFAI